MYTFKEGNDTPHTEDLLATSSIDSVGMNDFHYSKIEVHGDNCKKIRDRILDLLEKYGIEE